MREAGVLERALWALLEPHRIEAAIETAVAVVLILGATRLALRAAVAVLRRWMRASDAHRPADRRAQVHTLVPLAESVLRYVLYFAALVLILDRLGFNVSALVASAGLAGVALGFAAQPLIRDFLSGFLMLFENLIQVGDVVRIGDVTGEVERVGLRTTLVRRYSGELVTFPNGQILQFGNMSRRFMRAIVRVGVAYEADVQRAMTIMARVGREWAEAHPQAALGAPEVQGIQEFGASGIVTQLAVMVAPGAVGAAEQELRLRLKQAFDAEGVAMASPQRVVYSGTPPAGRDAAAGAQRGGT
ncbi:MAG: mechanosensitive ion channel family protein [Armatimonadota bacterium]|nr:mechanosensitive ion channel family protein [Armatimonadota bacterium]MDR7422010.1 mechanosensitive ion channel family protein [Armatimonadota bacterium]MDR7455210.1 mechanosensitive ion channel family protein [Armatimonadota bacterium]MDR7455710.1 mechanosensitive ion channel family protein [Armatimonadota bacterium]MDR7496955.1 mechanosensitive ion channel family protein [Armatimonadota bacterium]